MKWDARADSKLFFTILRLHAIKINAKDLAKEFGEDVTPKSIESRIYNLKKLATQEIPNETPGECGELLGEGGHRPAKRPRVSATKRESKETRAKKLRKGKAMSAADEEDMDGTPTKSENKDTQALGAEDTKAEDEKNENTHDLGVEGIKAEDGKSEDTHDLGVEDTKVEDGKNEDTKVETGIHEKQPNVHE